jgi:DNA adenine methylase
MTVGPFIKWVGGKRQLLPTLLRLLPKTEGTYFEPFIGGGSVFFSLVENGHIQRAVISDFNAELVGTYRMVCDRPEELISELRKREDTYNANAEATFKEWKAMRPDTLGPVVQASRFILLNKTGFNGMYRVNKKGVFNVPWSKKLTARIHNPDNIRACSRALKCVKGLYVGDFSPTLDHAKAGDLVYLDPPYDPVSGTANFTSYTTTGFGLEDQRRLRDRFHELHEKGVTVVLSNADTPEIRSLYAGFEIRSIQARRAINSKGDKRGPVGEVIVLSNPTEDTEKTSLDELLEDLPVD